MGGAHARGRTQTFSQLEFKMHTKLWASKGAPWAPSHAKFIAIGRSPATRERAAGGGKRARARGGGEDVPVRISESRGVTGFTRHFQHTFYDKRPRTEPKFECVRGHVLDFFSAFWCFWVSWMCDKGLFSIYSP